MPWKVLCQCSVLRISFLFTAAMAPGHGTQAKLSSPTERRGYSFSIAQRQRVHDTTASEINGMQFFYSCQSVHMSQSIVVGRCVQSGSSKKEAPSNRSLGRHERQTQRRRLFFLSFLLFASSPPFRCRSPVFHSGGLAQKTCSRHVFVAAASTSGSRQRTCAVALLLCLLLCFPSFFSPLRNQSPGHHVVKPPNAKQKGGESKTRKKRWGQLALVKASLPLAHAFFYVQHTSWRHAPMDRAALFHVPSSFADSYIGLVFFFEFSCTHGVHCAPFPRLAGLLRMQIRAE